MLVKWNDMTVQNIKREIEMLSPGEVSELQAWLNEQAVDQPIDIRIKADAQAGKLDWLVKEAMEEDTKGETTPLSL
jgi:hypothetical protein